MQKQFISKSIDSLTDWSDYLKAKGYKPITIDMTAEGGYYAELPNGTAQKKDFTQVFQGGKTSDWVRISRVDLTNSAIINS